MRALISKLFSRKAPAARPAPRRLAVEQLDQRILLTVSATVSGGSLNVFADNAADNIQVSYFPSIQLATVRESNSGYATSFQAPLSRVQFFTGSGGATFTAPSTLDCVLYGTGSNAYWDHTTGQLQVNKSSWGNYGDDSVVNTGHGTSLFVAQDGGNWLNLGPSVTSVVHDGQTIPAPATRYAVDISQGSLGDVNHGTFLVPADSGLQKVFVESITRERGGLSRADMLALYNQAASDGTVTAAENMDLTNITYQTGIDMRDDVRCLAQKVMTAFGPWHSGSASDLNWDVNKYFYGSVDRPSIDSSWASNVDYEAQSAPLFQNNWPSFRDVEQGNIGDCYLLASLAEVAYRNPQAIKDMFHANGDGTWTVRFFENGKADYVTVDNQLPYGWNWNTGETECIDAKVNGALWVGLAEKAYAVEHGNSYSQIGQGGYPADALREITGGHGRTYGLGDNQSLDANSVHSYYAGGDYVVLGSKSNLTINPFTNENSDGVADDHAYAFLGYDSSTGTNRLYNPWGSTLTLTNAKMQDNFTDYGCITSKAAPHVQVYDSSAPLAIASAVSEPAALSHGPQNALAVQHAPVGDPVWTGDLAYLSQQIGHVGGAPHHHAHGTHAADELFAQGDFGSGWQN